MKAENNIFKLYPVWEYNYEKLFRPNIHNGTTLNDDEREDFVAYIEGRICEQREGLQILSQGLKEFKDEDSKISIIARTIFQVALFTLLTMGDCLIASKYFLKADTNYDRCFMRGKLKVILNEGFKKLFGFTQTNKKQSEWARLKPLVEYFPEKIKQDYDLLDKLLEKRSRGGSWWKEERDLETHLDAIGLYESRQEEIVESKVMMESLDLYNSLLAVNYFVETMNAMVCNTLFKNNPVY